MLMICYIMLITITQVAILTYHISLSMYTSIYEYYMNINIQTWVSEYFCGICNTKTETAQYRCWFKMYHDVTNAMCRGVN